ATGAVVFAGSAIVIHDASLSVLAISLVVVFGQLLAAYAHHDWLRGAWLGLALGAVQLLAAVFMAQIGMRLFPERCMDMCFAIVLLGSVGVGFAFAKLFASRPFGSLRRGGLAFVAMGATMVALCCMAGSLALLTGSAFGVALGAAPGWVLLREA
ncbi:MAG: hypothetical protein AAFY60_08390, partial [Myxococcota bacterium]